VAVPGLLGEPTAFRRTFENPILRGQDADASDAEVAVGAERSAQLLELCGRFMLRRTFGLMKQYLPPKVEQVRGGARGRVGEGKARDAGAVRPQKAMGRGLAPPMPKSVPGGPREDVPRAGMVWRHLERIIDTRDCERGGQRLDPLLNADLEPSKRKAHERTAYVTMLPQRRGHLGLWYADWPAVRNSNFSFRMLWHLVQSGRWRRCQLLSRRRCRCWWP
jgi:hypothetical protein